MNRIKILLADPDTRFTELASRFLSKSNDFDTITCKSDGNEALKLIRSTHPDTVLFDLALPGLDGISLLRKVNTLQNPPVMICCTRFYSEIAMEAMRDYGAAYIMYKPVELQSLHAAILSCTQLHRKMRRLNHQIQQDDSSDLQAGLFIHNYIVSLGVPSKLIGCSYLTEAVRLGKSDVSLVRNLSKGLYLEISKSMDTTPERIERCIRNAISIAFQSGGLSGKFSNCPSNKEFIHYLIQNSDI